MFALSVSAMVFLFVLSAVIYKMLCAKKLKLHCFVVDDDRFLSVFIFVSQIVDLHSDLIFALQMRAYYLFSLENAIENEQTEL